MPDVPTRRVEHIWGTVITLDLRDAGAVTADSVDRVFDWFARIDELFSTWRPNSEISRLGRGELRLEDSSREVREVLSLCEEVRLLTWGSFDVGVAADPRVEPREGLAPIDPSGLVKGWALDRAADLLLDAGAQHFAINAGGDVLVRGDSEPGQPWRIGIQDPLDREVVSCVVVARNCGVATSGRYERGDHVLDPRSGAPATALRSATVVAPELAIADGLATGIFALGHEAGVWLDDHPEVAAHIVDELGVASSTPSFRRVSITDRPPEPDTGIDPAAR